MRIAAGFVSTAEPLSNDPDIDACLAARGIPEFYVTGSERQ